MAAFRYLDDDQFRTLRAAAVDAGLATHLQLDAMLAGLPPLYTGSLPGFNLAPNARLSVQLEDLNRVANLRDGTVPLRHWLQQAIFLTSERPEADVFEDFLDLVAHGRGAPPAATDLGAAPAATGPGGLGDEVAPAPGGAAPPAAAPPASSLADANLSVVPEAMVAGSDQTVDIAFLTNALARSRSVVKVLVHRHEEGEPVFTDGDRPRLWNGTGWFIGPELVITNHHVVNARDRWPVREPDAGADDLRLQAEHTTILYDYLVQDRPSAVSETGDGALQAADPDLDFAILRVPAVDPARSPMPLRRRIVRKRIQQALGTRVNLLQHPNGDPMRLGFRDNFVVLGDDDVLSYLTDTQYGSSGSPVCDDGWSVAALHAGSRSISAENLSLRGRKIRRENFGVPIPRILAHLEEHHPALHAEIMAAQEP